MLSSLLLVSGSLAQSLKGCYKDDGSMNNLGSYTFQSQGYCSTTCKAQGFSVFGMASGDECLCGASLPADSVASSFCNQACTGYPGDTCGGNGYISVWLAGSGTVPNNIPKSGSNSKAAAIPSANPTMAPGSPTTPVAPSVIYVTTAVVQQGATVVQTVVASATRVTTATPSSTSATASSLGSISPGMAAGIAISVIVVFVVGIATFILLRRRRSEVRTYRRQFEETKIGSASATTKPIPSLDSRLEISAMRRNSSESLADNQDYSRKILRVVN